MENPRKCEFQGLRGRWRRKTRGGSGVEGVEKRRGEERSTIRHASEPKVIQRLIISKPEVFGIQQPDKAVVTTAFFSLSLPLLGSSYSLL
eukprot:137535-Amorphochlora_amoeboformis.AAC.1